MNSFLQRSSRNVRSGYWSAQRTLHTVVCLLSLALLLSLGTSEAIGQEIAINPEAPNTASDPLPDWQQWVSPERIGGTLSVFGILTVASLVPAMILMTTSFLRIIVVLHLLRQALGIGQVPSNQILSALAILMSALIMFPVWTQTYQVAIEPYQQEQIDAQEAIQRGAQPIREFMSLQIERTGNQADIWLFLEYYPSEQAVETYQDVPFVVLLPAFMISELKTGFLIGFQVYLPFLVLDLVIASVLMAMGMVMLPPSSVSLPFKLLLFVLADGWHLLAGSLLHSFTLYSSG